MKIHITNLYNFNKNDELVSKQHRFTEAALGLGFREMGIFAYPVDTDSKGELSKRLDGILSSLEAEDVVFVQLPTTNGSGYESLLINKIKAYRGTKIVLILHEAAMQLYDVRNEAWSEYLELCKKADAVIAPTVREKNRLKGIKEEKLFYCDSGVLGEMYLQKTLLDALETATHVKERLAELETNNSSAEMHIGFGLHDKTGNYSVWVGVAMQSVIENTDTPVCFHILHDDTLNEQNKSKLINVVANGGHRIVFHLLKGDLFPGLSEQMGMYTIGALFRIVLPDVLDELSRIIYLDADVIVNRNIRELWDMDIDEYCMAAVPDADVVNGAVTPVPVKENAVAAYNINILIPVYYI